MLVPLETFKTRTFSRYTSLSFKLYLQLFSICVDIHVCMCTNIGLILCQVLLINSINNYGFFWYLMDPTIDWLSRVWSKIHVPVIKIELLMCRKQSHLAQKNVNHSFTLFCELAADIVTSICLNTAPSTYTYSKGKVKKKRECMNHKKGMWTCIHKTRWDIP